MKYRTRMFTVTAERRLQDMRPVDAVYINGGGWDAAPAIEFLERDLKIKVVWALAAEMWFTYHVLKIDNPVPQRRYVAERQLCAGALDRSFYWRSYEPNRLGKNIRGDGQADYFEVRAAATRRADRQGAAGRKPGRKKILTLSVRY